MAPLDPTDLVDLYWAGRTTMVIRGEQIPVYDRVFRRFFLDEADELPEPVRHTIRARADTVSVLQIPATDQGADEREEQPAQLGLVGSAAEILRTKSFAACTAEEIDPKSV